MVSFSVAIVWFSAFAAAVAVDKRGDGPWIVQPFDTIKSGAGLLSPRLLLSLGTPPQSISASADTGSWAAYLVAPGFLNSKEYLPGSLFNSTLLSTFKSTNVQRNAGWSSGTGTSSSNYYKGNWSTDTAQMLGGKQFTFTFDYSQPQWGTPLIGIDPNIGGADAAKPLITTLKSQGVIKEAVFAMYYDDLDAYTGLLSFGAVDTSKYIGDLVEIPYTNTFSYGNYSVYASRNNGLNNYVKEKLSNEVQNRMFDTGGIYVPLPADIYSAIHSQYSGSDGKWNMTKIAVYHPFVDVTFGGVFNISYLIYDNFKNQITSGFNSNGMLQSGGTNMGPPLLRYAYVVWDYERKRMLLGKRNPNPGPEAMKLVSEL